MKNFNFLSKNSSSSLENGSGMTRDCLGIASIKFCKYVAVLCLLFTLGIGNVWSYTLTFKKNSGDGSSVSSSTAASTLLSDGTSYVTGNCGSPSNTYYNGSNGLKLGASSSSGAVRINLADAGQLTNPKVTVRAKRYNSGKAATINVNSIGTQDVTADWDDYEFSVSGKITYIQLNSSKYIWIESITVATAAKTFTLAVPKGDGTYDQTQTGQEKTALTETNATKKATSCTYGLAGYYASIWTSSAINTPTTTYPSPVYTSSTADNDLPASGTTLYPVFTNDAGKYLTNPLCADPVYYTVTYNYGSGTGSPANWTQTSGNLSTTLPTATPNCDGWSFAGWCTSSAGSSATNTSSPGTILTGSYTPTADVTLYAVYTKSGGGGSSWTETDFADLTSSDVFVLATAGGYALPSNGGNAKPVVSSITVSNGVITSTVTDGLKWNMSGNSTDGYTFYPNGTTSTWLCCTTTANSGTNDNIRINNSGSRKVWITDANGDLKTNDTYVDRWLCNYNDADFRGYVSGSKTSDIISKCYKYVSGTTYYMTNYACSSCAVPTALTNGSFSLSHSHLHCRYPNCIEPITYPTTPYIYSVYIP